MKKLNKVLLTVGTGASIIAPISTVISCGTEQIRHFRILPTYTGQADQLIALGIHSDYYPRQLNAKKPYDYLENPGKYMLEQTDEFKAKFTKAIKGLMPKTTGVSWWNQDAKNSDDSSVDNTYWQKQKGDVLLYEHYLLDDDQKVIEESWAPKHHAETAIQTNFRASRDPYTRIPKPVFFGWDLAPKTINKLINGETIEQNNIFEINTDGSLTDSDKVMSATFAKPSADKKSIIIHLNGEDVVVNSESAKLIKKLRDKRRDFVKNGSKESTWFYNDYFFVDSYHKTYLDNADFQNSPFKKWLVDSTNSNPFDTDPATAGMLKKLFDASTYQGDEVKNGMNPVSYASHHPIYEQQGGEVGAAPMFEGAMRDNQLYLFNVAWKISNLALYGTPYGKQHYDALPQKTPANAKKGMFNLAQSKDEADIVKAFVKSHVSPTQYKEMTKALVNANLITDQLKTRLANIKKYFEELGVNGKRFGILTIAPGKGVSTIQSMSKFSFIYKELGLKQPMPTNLATLSENAGKFTAGWKSDGENAYLDDNGVVKKDNADVHDAVGGGSLFNMDDNGWFWNLGESAADGTNDGLSVARLKKFKGTFDMGIIAARDANYEQEIGKNDGVRTQVSKLFPDSNNKVDETVNNARVSYDLWNEGLKTPFVLHMLLDRIMTKAEEYATAHGNGSKVKKGSFADAASWGDYFTSDFVK